MLNIPLRRLHEVIGGQLRSAVAPRDLGSVRVRRIVTDSRLVEPGDVFWGLVGPRHNGGDYADEALMRGAAGMVVQGRTIDPWFGRFSLQVDDTTAALWKLAAEHRSRFRGRMIAVTGSVGKTTTREMIHTVLSATLTGTSSPQNYNNQFGVPLSLLGMDPADDYAAVELGASAPGEIARLAELARPEIGVLTCIGDAHLGGFGSPPAVADAKGELLRALPESGIAVINGDDARLRRLAEQCPAAKVVRAGRGADNDLVATDVRQDADLLRFTVDAARYQVHVYGRHHVTAALLAVAVGRVMGLSAQQIAAAVASFEPLPMRCQVIRHDEMTIINDTYNSSPVAMRAALDLLHDLPAAGQRVVVCGDMAELGAAARGLHYQIGTEVVTRCGANLLVACGEYAGDVVRGAADAGMPPERTVACRFPSAALPHLEHLVPPDSVVLIKGARALRMERVAEALLTQRAEVIGS